MIGTKIRRAALSHWRIGAGQNKMLAVNGCEGHCRMGVISIIGFLIFGTIAQLTLETSAELTAETFADNDVGISAIRSRIAVGDIIDLDPATMIIIKR